MIAPWEVVLEKLDHLLGSSNVHQVDNIAACGGPGAGAPPGVGKGDHYVARALAGSSAEATAASKDLQSLHAGLTQLHDLVHRIGREPDQCSLQTVGSTSRRTRRAGRSMLRVYLASGCGTTVKIEGALRPVAGRLALERSGTGSSSRIPKGASAALAARRCGDGRRLTGFRRRRRGLPGSDEGGQAQPSHIAAYRRDLLGIARRIAALQNVDLEA